MALTPAQLQERRDASRARWDRVRQSAAISAGAVAGGAAGALIADEVPKGVSDRPAQALASGIARLRASPARLDAGADRLLPHFLATRLRAIDAAREARETSIKRGFTKPLANEEPAKPSLVGLHARLLRTHIARGNAELDRLKAAYQNAASPDHADMVAESAGNLIDAQDKRRAALEELHALRPALRKPRAGSFPTRKAGTWDIRLPSRLITEAKAQPGDRYVRAAHRAKVRASDLDPETAGEIRTGLRQHADQVAERTKRYAIATADRDLPKARAGLEVRYLSSAERQLAGAFRPAFRRGVLGTGIAGGALLGGLALDRLTRKPDAQSGFAKAFSSQPQGGVLAKANPQDSDDNQDDKGTVIPTPLADAAKAIEPDLARGVARALASWINAATPERLANPDGQGGLFEHLDEPLATGMQPMDRASAAGLTQPVRIEPPGGTGGDDGREPGGPKPMLLHFGFNVRADQVQTYAKQYRYGRVREISDGQRRNIRQIIVNATNTADPPAVIARKIRDVVGLTAKQAQIVANYRLALEQADPRALTYSLRDKRFDGPIQRSIKDKTALTKDQIDRFVDAYQRRFIAHRAMTIARTEALRAANNGHAKTVRDYLYAHPDYTVAKTWMATEDDRTRPDHRGLHQKTVLGMETPFVCDSGEKLLYPHDPKGAAKEVIACRCTFITTLVPRAAAARHGAGAYIKPLGAFWTKGRGPLVPA